MKKITEKHRTGKLGEYARFGAAGLINTGVDFLSFNLIMLALSSQVRPITFTIAKGAAFCVAVTNSYYLNKHWVFGDAGREKANLYESGRFLAVSIAGFLFNLGISSLAFAIFGKFGFAGKIAANAAAVIGTGFTLVSNYLGYKLFVFNRPTHEYTRKEHASLRSDTRLQRIEAHQGDSRKPHAVL